MASTPTNLTIALRVREAMGEISEVVLADETGISRTTLRRRLTGKSDWLTGELLAVAGFLGVSLVDLLSDERAA